MDLLSLLIEGRREDFVAKYKNKFTGDQLKKIVMMSTEIDKNNKFLDFMGKVLTSDDVDTQLSNIKILLDKFKKFQNNLEVKDLNKIENLVALEGLISDYENRNRRNVKRLEGADEIYSDDNVTIVSPLNHSASCYYGAGTKWCTATMNSDAHFNKYNSEGKLFYIINKKLDSQNRLYKIALMNYFDGRQTLYDAKDDQIPGGWPGGTEQWMVYNSAIQNYLNTNYAQEIEIFKDKARAKAYLVQKYREQKAAENRQALEVAERRRQTNAWGPEVDDTQAKEARAVFEVVQEQIGVQEGEDIYNLIPDNYNHYGLNVFKWFGEYEFESAFAVGDNEDANEAAKDALKQLIDDVGFNDLFRKDFVRGYIDEDRVLDTYEEWITGDVYESPESYLDDDQRELSRQQQDEVEELNQKIGALREKQKVFSQEDQKWVNLQKVIDQFEEQIQEIQENPEGDFPDDLVEQTAQERLDEVRPDVIGYLEDMGVDINDLISNFVDMDELTDAVISSDGRGSNLSPYDGDENEVFIDGDFYFVYRIE
jgi:hypothetical protein